MSTEQREQLRVFLIDYLKLLSIDKSLYNKVWYDKRTAEVRLLLEEIAL